MKKKIIKIVIAILVAMIAFASGIATSYFIKQHNENEKQNETQIESDALADLQADSQSEPQPDESQISWLDSIPEYNCNPFVEINGNIPFFTEEEKQKTTPFEMYSALDSKGRCGVAFANICIELMPTEPRGEIGNYKPSGWQTVKYNEIIDGNYLYNRCHLIGYQLAGENDNVLNLITGTRYLNVIGMLPFENQVSDYVSSTNNHVLYRVTPVFLGDDSVASGVLMEAWSVEDKGMGVCFNVYCYNVQPGIEIDYATGESKLLDKLEDVNQDILTTEINEQDITDSTDLNETYILNTSSHKIHRVDCNSVSEMAEHNKKEYTGNLNSIIEQGFDPCHVCFADYYSNKTELFYK